MRRFAGALIWTVLVGVVVTSAIYVIVPEHRKRAGQTYDIQNHLWISTSAKWRVEPETRELSIQLVSLWGEGEVYYTHDRLTEVCNTVLGNLPKYNNGLVARDDVQFVNLELFQGWRAMAESGIRMRVEDGVCSRNLKPEPVKTEEPRIREPSADEEKLNDEFLNTWKNVSASFQKGSRGDGRYLEFVPKRSEDSIDNFDFLQACRLVLSRMPETQQTKLGLLDFLQRGFITIRVAAREYESGEALPERITRNFEVRDRDCSLIVEAN